MKTLPFHVLSTFLSWLSLIFRFCLADLLQLFFIEALNILFINNACFWYSVFFCWSQGFPQISLEDSCSQIFPCFLIFTQSLTLNLKSLLWCYQPYSAYLLQRLSKCFSFVVPWHVLLYLTTISFISLMYISFDTTVACL